MDSATVLNRLLTPSVANENLAFYSAGAALLVHAGVQFGEPGIMTWLPIILAVLVVEPLYLMTQGHKSLFQALYSTAIMNTTFVSVLFGSIAIYRLFFHKLCRLSGPKMAALTKFWNVSLAVEGRTPARIQALHDKHGDIVRIGPNELSILNSSAIPVVLGIQGQMPKGPWYKGSFTKKGNSVHALQDIHSHTQRRKFWDRGFSKQALQDYARFVNGCGEEWIEKLKQMSATPGHAINMSDWTSYVSFDTMGCASFGNKFGMVRDAKAHFYMTTIEGAMKMLCIFAEVPWILPLLMSLPQDKPTAMMYEFSMETTLKCKERGTAGKPDIFSYLMGEDQPVQANMNIYELGADIRTIIIAGSDTIASTMCFIIYYLFQHPNIMKDLQAEVEHLRGKEFDGTDLTPLKLLNAVIQETQRIKSVVPSKSQRTVPKGGAMIANQFVPGGAHVSVPFKATHHNPRNFSPTPGVWRPGRWLAPEKEQIMNQKTFIPFSTGPFNCAGRLLAQLEMRTLTTLFCHNFNGRLANGFDTAAFEDGILDRFTVQKGPMMVELQARK